MATAVRESSSAVPAPRRNSPGGGSWIAAEGTESRAPTVRSSGAPQPQSATKSRLVERAQKAASAGREAFPPMRAGIRRESGEGQLARAAQLPGRTVGQGLRHVLRGTPSAPASAAIVRATRATRERPRPESGKRSTARSRSADASGVRRTRCLPRARRAETISLRRPSPRRRRRRARPPAHAAPRPRGRNGRAAPARACRGRRRAAEASRSIRRRGRHARHTGTCSWSRPVETGPGTPPDPRLGPRRRLRPPAAGGAPRARGGRTRQLVQEQHPAMCERRLARPGTRAAASDDRGRRCAVVRGAKRPHRHPVARRQQPGDGVDARDLEHLSSVSGGRMPGRRRASIVLPVPGGPASRRLCAPAAASSSARRARSWPRTSARSGVAGEAGRSPRQRGDRARRGGTRRRRRGGAPGPLDSGEGCLGRRLRCTQDPLEPRFLRPLGGHQHAADRPDAAVQRELADGGMRRALRRHLTRRREHGQRDRESKPDPSFRSAAGARLTVIRCRGHSSAAEPRPPDPVLRLLTGTVGQADDGEAGNAAWRWPPPRPGEDRARQEHA